ARGFQQPEGRPPQADLRPVVSPADGHRAGRGGADPSLARQAPAREVSRVLETDLNVRRPSGLLSFIRPRSFRAGIIRRMWPPLQNDTFLRACLRQPTDYTPIWLM